MTIARTRTAALAIVAAGALAALGPLQSAVAFISPPMVLLASAQSPAKLVAKGAAVDVTVNYTCAGVTQMSLGVTLTESVGRRTASGTAYAMVPCTGHSETKIMHVTADATGASFGTGTAGSVTHVYGERWANGRFYWGEDTFSQTIKIAK